MQKGPSELLTEKLQKLPKRTLQELISGSFLLSVREILSNISRFIITSSGIFLGIGSLLVNIAFIRGIENDTRKNLEKIGNTRIVTVHMLEPQTMDEKLRFSLSNGLRYSDIDVIRKSLEFVGKILHEEEKEVSIGMNNVKCSGVVKGIEPGYLEAYNYQWVYPGSDMEKPYSFFPGDRNSVLIGKNIALTLFGSIDDAIGKKIPINDKLFDVCGIHTHDIQTKRANELFISIVTYRQLFESIDKPLSAISFEIDASCDVQASVKQIDELIKRLHRGIKDYEITANIDKIEEIKNASRGLSWVLIVIAMISLLVASVSIMNIMFATINHRIREIGIRKAIGARKIDILMQFLIESVVVCMVGGFPAFFVGFALVSIPSDVFPFPPILKLTDYGLCLGAIITAGLISGMLPALKAADYSPVQALQN